MSATERAKGARWESALVSLLRRHGWTNAERAGSGHDQRHGDLLGIPGWVIECKNCRALSLGTWIKQAETQAKSWRYALMVKRVGHSEPAEGFAVLPIGSFLALLREAGY
jgi:hypothetical protein